MAHLFKKILKRTVNRCYWSDSLALKSMLELQSNTFRYYIDWLGRGGHLGDCWAEARQAWWDENTLECRLDRQRDLKNRENDRKIKNLFFLEFIFQSVPIILPRPTHLETIYSSASAPPRPSALHRMGSNTGRRAWKKHENVEKST